MALGPGDGGNFAFWAQAKSISGWGDSAPWVTFFGVPMEYDLKAGTGLRDEPRSPPWPHRVPAGGGVSGGLEQDLKVLHAERQIKPNQGLSENTRAHKMSWEGCHINKRGACQECERGRWRKT